MSRLKLSLILMMVALLGVVAVQAQDMAAPQVNLPSDQLVLEKFVTISSIYSEGPGFVVIHRTSDGGVVGVSAPLTAGWTYNLRINLDTSKAEAQMSAMLHVDDNTVGTYEFGTVEGADAPVSVDGNIVNPLFNAQVLDATDQKLENNEVTVRSVTVAQDSWVVIHAGDGLNAGAVLGQTLVKAGTTADVKVAISGEITPILWPMLHFDTGAAGTYEFGTVEGADAPIIVSDQVATYPVWTVNHIRVADQIVIHGDNLPGMETMDMSATPKVVAKSVFSEGPGILVIHANDNGNAGAILGAAFVNDGLTENVEVELDASMGITPIVWPMLHVDAGTIGVYDGLDVDTVASALGQAVTYTINAAPSLVMVDGPIHADDSSLHIEKALIDAPGWLAIHSDNNGQPGPVIATVLLHAGANWDIEVEVDPAQAGTKVFPMLHYDTGAMGTYEFGTVADADAPVFVQEQVVVGLFNITQ